MLSAHALDWFSLNPTVKFDPPISCRYLFLSDDRPRGKKNAAWVDPSTCKVYLWRDKKWREESKMTPNMQGDSYHSPKLTADRE